MVIRLGSCENIHTTTMETLIILAAFAAFAACIFLPGYIRGRVRKALCQVRGFSIFSEPTEQRRNMLVPINYEMEDDRTAQATVMFDQEADTLHFILPKGVISITAIGVRESGKEWKTTQAFLGHSSDNITKRAFELEGARRVLLVDTFSKGVIATIVIDDITK